MYVFKKYKQVMKKSLLKNIYKKIIKLLIIVKKYIQFYVLK